MKPLKHKHTLMIFFGIIFAVLFLLTGVQPAARADTGPALEETTAIGSVVSPYKFKRTWVQMVDEQVRLKVQPVTAGQILYQQVEVQASFHLFNTSNAAESMQAVFPLTRLKCPWLAGPGAWSFHENAIDENSFQVSIDGQPVPIQPLTTTTLITQRPAGISSEIELKCQTTWKQFSVTFSPRRDVRIQVGYTMRPPSPFELGDGMTGYPWDSFTYILKTGAPWSGPIGQVDLSMELPEPAKREQFLKLPAGYHINKNTIRWRWQNLEPVQDFEVVMMSFQTQKELAEVQQALNSNPKDAPTSKDAAATSEALARLAGLYESLAWRYDYPAGCSSSIDYASFWQIHNWEYAGLALNAYQRLLKLRPQDGEAQTKYANLLAEMSLSGNNGVLLAAYPSVGRVLREFDRALALGATDQAQRLLDSFRHCIVKSRAEPPVCQCGF